MWSLPLESCQPPNYTYLSSLSVGWMAGLGLVHDVRPLPFVRWGDLHILCHSSLFCFTFWVSISLMLAFLHRSMEPAFTPLQGFVANRVCMGVLSFSCHAALPCVSCSFSAWACSHVGLHLGWHPHDFHYFTTHTLNIAYVCLPLVAWPMLSCWSRRFGMHRNIGDFFVLRVCIFCTWSLQILDWLMMGLTTLQYSIL